MREVKFVYSRKDLMNIIRFTLFLMLSWHQCKGLELITLARQLDRFAAAPAHTGSSVAKKRSFAAINDEMIREIVNDLEKYIDDNFSLFVEKNEGTFTWRVDPANPTLIRTYKKLAENENDVFCQIIQGKLPARVLFSDAAYIGIFSKDHPISTQASTKILVIPKKHTHSIMTLMQETSKKYPQRGYALKALLKRGHEAAESLGSQEYTLSINRGSPLQAVPHVHLHVLMTHQPTLNQPIINSLKFENKNWNEWGRTAFVIDGRLVIETYKK
jgi:diadenosine tetraphosphate (Ap4A) HIT family hydrolase